MAQSSALDSKIPAGSISEKWEEYKGHVALVAPNNKRRIDVIIVGSGLAGAAGLKDSVEFHIQAQKLSTALLEFSKQAGVQVLTATEIVSDVDAPTVQGRMIPTEALE